MENMQDSVDWLHSELDKHQAKNPAYSMRAFAKLAGTSPGRMSEYLSRKRQLSPKVARRFINNLVTSPERNAKLTKLLSSDESEAYSIADPACVATKWYHYAILSLTETVDFDGDPLAISRRLGLPVNKVRQSIEELHRANLIKVQSGRIESLVKNTATVSEVPSAIIRESQKESMRRTIERIDNIPLALRDISSMTMAIDSRKVPEAKAALKKFRRSLAKLLEAGEQDEVYELNIQFMPLSERKF